MADKREYAETIALEALAWLAGNNELLPVFLGASGVSATDLRRRAAEPEFLGSVLDFLMLDDAWVVEFARAAGIAPEALRPARRALPGGETLEW